MYTGRTHPNNLPQPVLMARPFISAGPVGAGSLVRWGLCQEVRVELQVQPSAWAEGAAAEGLETAGSCVSLLGSAGLGSGRLLRSSTVGPSGSNWHPVHCEGPVGPPHTAAVGASSCPRTPCRRSQRAFPLPPKHSHPSNVAIDPEGLIPCALCWVELKSWGRCGAFKSPTAELGRTLAITEAALCQVGK